MLSNKKIVCPNNLISAAKKTGTVNAAIVNAGEIFPMESVHKAVQHNLINPTFIGNESEIKKYADKLKAKIRKMRKTGLETIGAYSVENLAFKVLRRNDYLGKLSDAINSNRKLIFGLSA